jgi:hypothetical protein
MMMDQNVKADSVRTRLQDSVFLQKEEYAYILQEVIETPIGANNLIGAFPIEDGVDPFQTYYEYTKLDKYGNATESDVPGDADAITVNGSKVRVAIPFYHADFTVSEFDLNTSRRLGTKLDAVMARAAAEKVNTALNEALWNKSSVFGTLGAYGLFTGTASAATEWTSASAESIFNDVNSWLSAIPEAYQSDQNVLILNQTQYFEMGKANTYGLSARKMLQEAYPGLRILFNKQVTATYGLIYPFRKDVVHLVLGFPLTTVEWDVKRFEARYKVLRSARLVVVTPAAGIKLSGL